MLHTAIQRARQTRRTGQAGFTLIELLIVIVVLGILAGIVVFSVATFRTDATTAAHNADCKTVSVAAEAYNAKNGNYPATVQTLVDAHYLKSVPGSIAGTVATTSGDAAGC